MKFNSSALLIKAVKATRKFFVEAAFRSVESTSQLLLLFSIAIGSSWLWEEIKEVHSGYLVLKFVMGGLVGRVVLQAILSFWTKARNHSQEATKQKENRMHGIKFVRNYFLMLIGCACFGLFLGLIALLLKRLEVKLETLVQNETMASQATPDSITKTKL